ncbi:hypothetical protein ACP4OV_012591 [Aristida adscensionis]
MSALAPTPTRGGGGGGGGGGGRQNGRSSSAMPRAEAEVEAVEGLIDADDEAAEEELFWEALLRDAHATRAADDKDDCRHARVLEPWQLPPSPPPLQQLVAVVTPAVSRATLLGLRAPPHLQRRTPPAPAGTAPRPQGEDRAPC